MLIANLTFTNTDWLWPAAVVVGLLAVLLWWGYRTTAQGSVHRACVALKLIGIVLLAGCLLEPLWTGQRARPGANLFAVIADNSLGMQIRDAGESQTRGELLQTVLADEDGGWQAALEADFDLRRFTFDARLQATRDYDSLGFEGRSSALGSALQDLRRRFQGRPLAGVLLFTDGNATDPTEAMADLSELPPVYPVMCGRPGGARDVAIANVNVTQTAFEDAPVTVQADVRVIGLRGETVVARLLEAGGAPVEAQTQQVKRDEDTLAFRFQLRPEHPELSFYQIEATLQQEPARVDESGESQEATLWNNARVVTVDRGGGPYRVLYVAGRPNWEYKFLHRAVAEDSEVELTALIRVARQEARFDFLGRSGETSNPLFRGTENPSSEVIERYDEPVIMRLNTRDEFELRGGFPSLSKDLHAYHAVILDDVEAEFFTADQLTLLQRYVSERGGGLLMLGGMESFQNGGYRRTPVGEMLPVYLDPSGSQSSAGPVRMELTREGWIEAWARLRSTEQEETVRLQSMPPFQVRNAVGAIKPGASVIATAVDEQNRQYPVLITQRFGRGRTAALTVGDIWRWGMQDQEARADMNKFWRQLVRWLVADVPETTELTVIDNANRDSGAVRLQVRVKNESFEPLENASVVIEVQNALQLNPAAVAAEPLRLRAEASSTEAGLYEAEYVARDTGGYRAVAYVTNSVGAALLPAEAGWSVDLEAKESASIEPNLTLLEDLARRTGGEMVPVGRLKEFVRELPHREAVVMEPWTRSAWHNPALFLLALACFIGEWGLRRWKGLP